ncbi:MULTISPECIES: hypothetical protein [unclassified Sphingopyxis]|uniref:hypothetical protein n=2 Tax=Sphingopyxis TaxID=165697 RepID=UPI001E3418A7|nr:MULTISPECIES: hypothetical protein [unclassified Sphingopyxis]
MFNLNATLDSVARPRMVSSPERSAMQANLSSEPSKAEMPPPVLGDWLWKPWYAKIWWAAIPLYWAITMASLKIPALASFFETALVGYLNVLFFPMTALLVLGFGFVRARLDAPTADRGDPLTDEEIDELERLRVEQEMLWNPPDHLRPVGDIYDPFSGTSYIGNPLSPNNGSRI